MRNIYSNDGSLRNLLAIDIETRKDDKADEYIKEHKQFAAPSNYKSTEAINKYIEKRQSEEIRKSALYIPTARVWAIVCYDHHTRTYHEFVDADERKLLCDCFNLIQSEYKDRIIYGFNSRHFDFPMLIGAAIKSRIAIPQPLQISSQQSDVLDVFGHMKVKLADIAYCIGDSKLMSGSDVADEWLKFCLGDKDAAIRVVDYCRQDVALIAEFVDRYTEDYFDGI